MNNNKTKFKLSDVPIPNLALLRTLRNIGIISYSRIIDLNNDVFYMSLVLEPKRK